MIHLDQMSLILIFDFDEYFVSLRLKAIEFYEVRCVPTSYLF